MTRSTKRCLHCRLKLRRVAGRWLHESAEAGAACAAYRRGKEGGPS